MKKSDCIFCKIANGEIPALPVYEDADFKVILDRGPASKGHALILPKEHFDNAYSMDEYHSSKVFTIATKVANAQKKAFNCDGVNILQNNEKAAGQTVFHFHMHVIPRFNNDSVNVSWVPGEITDEQISEYVSAMKNNM